MKYIISFLLLLFGISEAKAQCDVCEAVFGCIELEVRSGRSATINSNTPVNLRDLFNIKGRTPEMLMSDPLITWWFIDASGNPRKIQNTDSRATAYTFNVAEWGKVEVYVTFPCITGGPTKTSKSAFIEVLDYAIYFYGTNSNHFTSLPWKFRSSETSTVSTNFFDRNRPTIIYIPGWNKGSVADKSRERLRDNTGQSMVAYWRNLGWNVGIFHWNQFSDELSPADVEGKMYDSEGLEKLTFGNRKNWRRSDGSLTRDVSPDSSMVNIFLEQYYNVKSALLGNGKELRLAGHSLGAELMCISMAQATPAAFLPDRIALLDPWWTLGKQDGYKNALQKLAAGRKAIEWYTTTNLQKMSSALDNISNAANLGLSGWALVKKFLDLAIQQANYQMMLSTAAQVSLRPKFTDVNPFDPIGTITNEHKAAVWWYFTSILANPPTLATNISYDMYSDGEADMTDDEKKIPMLITETNAVSAAACNADIVEMRGRHFLHTNGTKTLTVTDDTLLENEIVIPLRRPLPFSRDKLRQATGTTTPVSANNPAPAAPAPLAERFSPDRLTTPLPVKTNEVKIDQAAVQAGSPISYYNIYSFDQGYPIATAWHTSRAWRGNFKREEWKNFPASKASNAGFPAVRTSDYNCEGLDRGHMTPSADRNFLLQEMGDTYFMNNMVPQNPLQNQHRIWARAERYLADKIVGKTTNARGVATGLNMEVFIFAGALPSVSGGTTNAGVAKNAFTNTARIKVPGQLWKVVLFHVPGQPFDLANTNMMAILFPNRHDAGADWTRQIKTVDEIEALTGYNFFDKLDDAVENTLEGRLFDKDSYIALDDQLEPGQNREETACRSMSLTPGFNAAQGSRFKGSINPNCGSIARPARVTTTAPATSFALLPNPTNGQVTLRFGGANLPAGQPATVSITDVQGRVLRTQSIPVMKGSNQLQLNLTNFKSGTYLVQLRTTAQTVTTKLVKQ